MYIRYATLFVVVGHWCSPNYAPPLFMMKFRIKSPAGSGIIAAEESWTISRLADAIVSDIPSFQGKRIRAVKSGYPPKPLDYPQTATLTEAKLRSNEQLLVEFEDGNNVSEPSATARSAPSDEIPHVHISELNQYLILRNVPDDNACLFNAITYALQGTFKWSGLNLRDIVASTVEANPQTYDELVLGRTPAKYCEWIRKEDAWGGAIELGILSKYLNVRINCFDVELGRSMVFQDEEHVPAKFVCLIYSGIHYDCFVTNQALTQSKTGDVGGWSENEDAILHASATLVSHLQKRNYTTNTTTFRVRCLECYEILVGEMGATNHANSKGHFRFGEV